MSHYTLICHKVLAQFSVNFFVDLVQQFLEFCKFSAKVQTLRVS